MRNQEVLIKFQDLKNLLVEYLRTYYFDKYLNKIASMSSLNAQNIRNIKCLTNSTHVEISSDDWSDSIDTLVIPFNIDVLNRTHLINYLDNSKNLALSEKFKFEQTINKYKAAREKIISKLSKIDFNSLNTLLNNHLNSDKEVSLDCKSGSLCFRNKSITNVIFVLDRDSKWHPQKGNRKILKIVKEWLKDNGLKKYLY